MNTPFSIYFEVVAHESMGLRCARQQAVAAAAVDRGVPAGRTRAVAGGVSWIQVLEDKVKMANQTEFEQAVARLLVSALELEDVDAADIQPEAPLFGHEPGSLGLDSIDALEIALAINQQFAVELRADDEQNSQVFATLKSLSDYVQAARAASA